jgi:predicted nucleic acid-binding protein
MTIVDSSVLLDVFGDDPDWVDWAISALNERRTEGDLLINEVIYAEVSISYDNIERFELVLKSTGLRLSRAPREALFLAGKAYLAYRNRGGLRRSPLPDFIIGAHAAVAKVPLLTRDTSRISTYFPTVEILAPS